MWCFQTEKSMFKNSFTLNRESATEKNRFPHTPTFLFLATSPNRYSKPCVSEQQTFLQNWLGPQREFRPALKVYTWRTHERGRRRAGDSGRALTPREGILGEVTWAQRCWPLKERLITMRFAIQCKETKLKPEMVKIKVLQNRWRWRWRWRLQAPPENHGSLLKTPSFPHRLHKSTRCPLRPLTAADTWCSPGSRAVLGTGHPPSSMRLTPRQRAYGYFRSAQKQPKVYYVTCSRRVKVTRHQFVLCIYGSISDVYFVFYNS